MQDPMPSPSPTPFPFRQTALTLLLLAVVGGGLFFVANRFAGFEVAQDALRVSRPRVSSSRPVDGDKAMPADAPVRVDLFTPTVGKGVDSRTLSGRSVRVVRLSSGETVAANLTAAADGGSVSLTPAAPLAAGETYRLEVTDALRDETGQGFIPYAATFAVATDGRSARAETRGGSDDTLDAVSDVSFLGRDVAYRSGPSTGSLSPSMYSALAWGPSPDGPDRHDLFAATADGRIFRYKVARDGTLAQRGVSYAILYHNGGPRIITGLAFDPRDPTVLWVSHGVAAMEGAPDFSGKLSTLGGGKYKDYADRVIGLPRAYKDHMNFALAFAPGDGSLYLSQGSNTGSGAPDTKWNNRPERLLSAAILKIDTEALPRSRPLDVTTADGGGVYDPFADAAPLTIHATGVRSGFDLLWHSSGHLFTAINGAGRGGNTPSVGAGDALLSGPIMSVPVTTDDTLADVTAFGGFHGHPNPLRGERVLMGGNPTPAADPYEIAAYPVGTKPDSRFVTPAFDFGKGYSANGLCESRADVFGGKLKGCVFAARFSAGDDIVILKIDENGRVVGSTSNVPGLTGLGSPLCVVEDPDTGVLFVSEYDSGKLHALVPIESNGPAGAVVTTND